MDCQLPMLFDQELRQGDLLIGEQQMVMAMVMETNGNGNGNSKV